VAVESETTPALAMIDASTSRIQNRLGFSLTSGPSKKTAPTHVVEVVQRDARNLRPTPRRARTPTTAMIARSLVVLDCQFPDQPFPRPTTLAEVVMYAMTITTRQPGPDPS